MPFNAKVDVLHPVVKLNRHDYAYIVKRLPQPTETPRNQHDHADSWVPTNRRGEVELATYDTRQAQAMRRLSVALLDLERD